MAWHARSCIPKILIGPATCEDIAEVDQLAELLPAGVYVASVAADDSALVLSPSTVVSGIAAGVSFRVAVNHTKWVVVYVTFVPVPVRGVEPERFVSNYANKQQMCRAWVLGGGT